MVGKTQVKRASVPTRKDAKTNKSVAYKLWYIELRDHNETIRRLPAFSDRKQSEAFGRNLERLVAARVNREAPSVELGRWLESLPSGTRDKLARIGLLDVRSSERAGCRRASR